MSLSQFSAPLLFDHRMKVERIPGDYNMEIPAILHQVFLYSEIPDIVKMTRVSTTFRRVGTSDYLWKDIVSDIDGYLPPSTKLSQMVFFYDIKKDKEGIYENMRSRLKLGFKRRRKFIRKRRKDRVDNAIDYTWKTLLVFGLACFSSVFPCCGIPVQGMIGTCIAYLKFDDTFYTISLTSITDTIFSTFCACCGFQLVLCFTSYILSCGWCMCYGLFCCLPCIFFIPEFFIGLFCGYLYTVLYPFIWLTRILFTPRKYAEFVEYTSVSLICLVLALSLGMGGFFVALCFCAVGCVAILGVFDPDILDDV